MGNEVPAEGEPIKTPPAVDQAQATETADTPPVPGTGSNALDEIMALTGGPATPAEKAAAQGGTPTPEDPATRAAVPAATEQVVAETTTVTPAPEGNPLFEEPKAPPAVEVVPAPGTDQPAAATATDALAGIVDPTFKALVEGKTRNMVTHIENGAAFLKQGLPAEATNAYKQAADLVSPAEQKVFLEETKKLAEMIKAETAKPADQQDAKKLEALKVLERQTRTLGLVDMFTEMNSGLIWTQAGDMNKAGDCFARALLNEKALVDAKVLPPEGYLSKEPNLGARVNEISQRLGVPIWKMMGDAVQRAGVDPKLVGIDTGRGPPVRTEGGGTPEVVAPGTQPQAFVGPPNERPVVAPGGDRPVVPAPGGDQPAVTPGTAEVRTEQGVERTVPFSPTDAGARTPLEAAGYWIDKALESGELTQEHRTKIEQAIADADKGVSSKLREFKLKFLELSQQKELFLDAKVGNTQEKVVDAVTRIDQAALGTFERKPNPADPTQLIITQTKEGVIDKLLPPADLTKFPMSDRAKAANPPADYKAAGPKPATFTGTDEEFRVQSYRNDVRTLEYRQAVKALYASMDEAMADPQYADTLTKLKALHPDNKAFMDLLTERDQVTTQARTALLPLNLLAAKIPSEENQSAMTRALYADLLLKAKDNEGAKRYFTEAYAWNQLPEQTSELRDMAMAVGADPITLLEAAVKQNQDRGSGNYMKCNRVETLLQESNLIFEAAAENKKAEVAGKLAPTMQKLQKMAEDEYAVVQARSKALNEEYLKNLPADEALRTELKTLEGKMQASEAKFTPADIENANNARNPELTEAQRKTAADALALAQPDWFRDSTRYREILGPKGPALIEAQSKIKAHIPDINMTGNNLFYSRAIQANMQNVAGDKAAAKTTLTAAFASVPGPVRTMILKNSKEVSDLAKAVDLKEADITALAQPAALAVPAERPPTATASGQQPTPEVVAPGGPPAAGTDQPAPAPAQPEGPKGNPNYAKMTEADIENKILEKSGDLASAEEVKSMYRELIFRYDAALNKADYEASIPSMKLLTEALKQGKDIKDGPNGTRVLGDEALTPERRWRFHKAIYGDMEAMNNQIRARQEFAQFLKASGQYKDAETMGIEARDLAEQLVKPREVDGKTVRIVDFMAQEATKLLEDKPLVNGNDEMLRQMQIAYTNLQGRDVDSGAIKTPINTNKFLAQLYLGTEIIPKLNAQGKIEGIQDIKFGQSSAFKPELAIDPANRALQLTRDILKIDPLDAKTAKENPGVASLFGVLAEVIESPEKYKLYVAKGGETFVDAQGVTRELKSGEIYGKNQGDIPILIDLHSKANLMKQIKKDSTFDSVLLDAGITIGVLGTIALSRNPRVAQFFERSLGKYGTVAGKAVKVAGYTAIPAGILGRNYGFRAMTGVNESFTDSTVHVLGSLAAAEVGGRMSGRGSFITGTAAGPRQFAMMDTKTSAQFYTKEGYETTGKLMDLLKSQGYINEAKAFVNMDRGTKLFIEAGKVDPKVAAALERAQLTGARSGAIAEALIKDSKLSSGIKHDELASRLARADAGEVKTIGDLERMVAADQQAVVDLSKRTEVLVQQRLDAVSLTDGLKHVKGTTEGNKLFELADRLGLKNVGDARKLAVDLEKVAAADRQTLTDLLKRTDEVAERGDRILITDLLKGEAGTAEGQRLLAVAEKFSLKRVGPAQQLAAKTEQIGFDKVFPKLAEMQSGKLIESSTSLSQVATMGTHVFEGPGLQRLISLVPAGERAGLFTTSGLKEVMKANPISGDRSIIARLRDGAVATRDGTVATWNAVSTREGWKMMRTAVGDTLAPLGNKSFYTKTVPGAAYDASAWGLTKLNSGRKVVTDRLRFTAIDGATATPEALARGRFASGFYGALGAAGTYNTLVKPYDLTGQIGGLTVPQIGGDGRPHAVYTNAGGEDFTWFAALKESHFPTVEGANVDQLPAYARWLVPVASAAMGTPGQALFGSMFLKPGAIYKPIWSNPETSGFKKTMQSVFPLSPTRWNNWNAGVFSGPTLATGGVFAGTAIPSSLDGLGARIGRGKYTDLLRNAQRPIVNDPLPTQRTNLEEARDQVQPQPAGPTDTRPAVPPTPAGPTDTRPATPPTPEDPNKPKVPPPPG